MLLSSSNWAPSEDTVSLIKPDGAVFSRPVVVQTLNACLNVPVDALSWCRVKTARYVDGCRHMFGIEDYVDFWIGENDLPLAHLTHPSGSSAVVYLHGANVTSWTKPSGEELLHVRSQPEDDVIS